MLNCLQTALAAIVVALLCSPGFLADHLGWSGDLKLAAYIATAGLGVSGALALLLALVLTQGPDVLAVFPAGTDVYDRHHVWTFTGSQRTWVIAAPFRRTASITANKGGGIYGGVQKITLRRGLIGASIDVDRAPEDVDS